MHMVASYHCGGQRWRREDRGLSGKMYGPEPQGRWSTKIGRAPFQSLTPGQRYEIVRAFTDFEGDLHPVGERWTFLGSSFAPYDDGLSLFVSLDGIQEWQLSLQWRTEQQGPIIDKLESYVQTVAGSG
jgi:hypothetical protein